MDSFLRKRVAEGVIRRYGPKNDHDLLDRAKKQVDHELVLIERLGFAGYFLIVWDIVQFCKENDILMQGRGSAANSAVCYALEITAIDPVGMKLLFERFLSENRGEWPDIDLDLRRTRGHDDRERDYLSREVRCAGSGKPNTRDTQTLPRQHVCPDLRRVPGLYLGLRRAYRHQRSSSKIRRVFRDGGPSRTPAKPGKEACITAPSRCACVSRGFAITPRRPGC
jgi:Bacterial DNA polymerase III alpha NTPase domain